MRDSGAKGANYFQESEAGGWRAEIRDQKPERADANCTNYANLIRHGFGIRNRRVGLAFNQCLGLAPKNAGFNPFKITALLAQLPRM